MSKSLSTFIAQAVDALPQSAIVIDNYGVILHINQSSGDPFPFSKACAGSNYFDLLLESISSPVHPLSICEPLLSIIEGSRLVFSTEVILRYPETSPRKYRIDAFPLPPELPDGNRRLVISHQDLGPVPDRRRVVPVKNKLLTRQSAASYLPICAACKCIRNEDEEWLPMERFFQQRFTVQFTHDICPDCIRQLYPKYAGALNMTANH